MIILSVATSRHEFAFECYERHDMYNTRQSFIKYTVLQANNGCLCLDLRKLPETRSTCGAFPCIEKVRADRKIRCSRVGWLRAYLRASGVCLYAGCQKSNLTAGIQQLALEFAAENVAHVKLLVKAFKVAGGKDYEKPTSIGECLDGTLACARSFFGAK